MLDTNILIDHLRRSNQKGISILRELQLLHELNEMCISVITIQELFHGKSSVNPKTAKGIHDLIKSLNSLPYNIEVAELAGKIMRDSKENISFSDAAVAATALLYKMPLVTLNTKDFAPIKGINLYKIDYTARQN